MGLVDAHRLPVGHTPPRQTDTEGNLVGQDLVRPFVPRPDRLQDAPRLICLVDRQRVVRDELGERIRDPVEQRIEALLAQDVVKDVRKPAVRLDERRPVRDRSVQRLLVDEAQWKSAIAHLSESIRVCSRSGAPISRTDTQQSED